MAIGAFLDMICETFNSQGIPPLIDINGEHFAGITEYPKMSHGDIADVDVTKVAAFIKDMTGIGILVPDDGLEDYIRQVGHLPERTTDDRTVDQRRKQQAEQNQPPEPETAAGSDGNDEGEEIPDNVAEAAKRRLDFYTAGTRHSGICRFLEALPPRFPGTPQRKWLEIGRAHV